MARILLFALAIALGTVLLGWWSVPLVAAGGGLILGRGRTPGLVAAVGAALAWGGILVVYRISGLPVDTLARRLGGAMGVPASVLIGLTIAFPAVLAGSAAWLGSWLGNRRAGDGSP
ncbi:MAG: hypothetical protein MNPFHGCM_00785 [Gemmatimonadaceae bacterium]|nr:hypothetical protein [Gemmatimonadaceae bacterium]